MSLNFIQTHKHQYFKLSLSPDQCVARSCNCQTELPAPSETLGPLHLLSSRKLFLGGSLKMKATTHTYITCCNHHKYISISDHHWHIKSKNMPKIDQTFGDMSRTCSCLFTHHIIRKALQVIKWRFKSVCVYIEKYHIIKPYLAPSVTTTHTNTDTKHSKYSLEVCYTKTSDSIQQHCDLNMDMQQKNMNRQLRSNKKAISHLYKTGMHSDEVWHWSANKKISIV